jgi:hypothetical protein
MLYCYEVTLSHQKDQQILKMSKWSNSLMKEYFCNFDTVTLCDTALCDIFDRHLINGRRHGMYILVCVGLVKLGLAKRNAWHLKGNKFKTQLTRSGGSEI